MGSCLSWSISLFFPKQLHAALILDFFFCSVFEVCGLSEVFEFFADQLVYLRCLHGCCVVCLSLVYFRPISRLSEFKLFKCFSVCFVFLLRRATSSANLKFVRFSTSTLIPSETSAFLKTSSITAVNSLGESESTCLTPLFIGNSPYINLSK